MSEIIGGTADGGLHERTPYWLNGLVPLAFLLRNAGVRLPPVVGIYKAAWDPQGTPPVVNVSGPVPTPIPVDIMAQVQRSERRLRTSDEQLRPSR